MSASDSGYQSRVALENAEREARKAFKQLLRAAHNGTLEEYATILETWTHWHSEAVAAASRVNAYKVYERGK